MGSIGSEDLAHWEKAEQGGGGGGGKEGERILVSVRLRPLSAKEIERNDSSDWECINNTTVIFKNSLPDRSMYPTAYTFDRVFGFKCSSRDVYEEGAKEVALSVVSGINATVFAYGQTSSGKTYTMTGITEYSVADIYDYIKRHEERVFILKFSAMEIYNEAVRDLLSMDSSPLRLLDDPERGTIVEKLTEETLRDQSHLKELLSLCEAQRQIGETSLNEMSSRSHQILRLTIESSAREFVSRNSSSTLAATVNFVDLAGSERASQASSAGARLKEGCHINRSLLTLGTVIRKLSKGRTGHIPYRDSKLTRILQSSLGGNARTAVICTLSPARSHVEQSRNTLLFASCAKQVVTNAQVNVVMSDKELVKHLQRELARLETELRYPGSASCTSHCEALRNKDAQIEKMEREIKELVQQRDLAQSRVEDLLRAVGNDRSPRQWDESSRPSTSHDQSTLEDACSISGTSGIAYQSPDFGSTRFCTPQENSNLIEPHIEFSDKVDGEQDMSPRHSVSSSTFSGMILQNRSDNKFEDHCKEVRCIEIHALSTTKSEEFNIPSAQESDDLPSQVELTDVDKLENSGLHHKISDSRPSVEGPMKSITKIIDDVVKPCLGESSPQSVKLEVKISRELAPTGSRSCEASSNTASSFWSEDAEQHHELPPTHSLDESPDSPNGVAAETPEMEHDANIEACLYEESQNTEKLSGRMVEAQVIRIVAEEDFTNSSDHFSLEMSQSHHIEDLPDEQETQQEEQVEEFEVDRTVKDVGVDSVLCSVESSSRWSFDFESKQQEIIKLWHACNVSLVHRTYFFRLFKGDPADSFYMEVEHRRLSFLRDTSHGHCCTAATDDGHNAVLSSSLKYLRREREMLCRQMRKKLSPEERIMLYTEWGIALDSKQRRAQLARRLWAKTDMAHIRESASLVAKLIGLLEQGQALKEMFGLSFVPRRTNHRSFGWKHRKSSLP